MGVASYSSAYDQRTQFASGSGTQIAPGAAVVSPGAGAVNAAAGAAVTQTIKTENEGFQAADVAQLLGMVEEDRAGERAASTNLAQSLAAGFQSQAAQTADILAATKAPDSTTLTKLMPLLIVIVVAYFLMR